MTTFRLPDSAVRESRDRRLPYARAPHGSPLAEPGPRTCARVYVRDPDDNLVEFIVYTAST